ncbi:PAS domain S-box protein [Desulfomonile tiedjei]|uniref:histidine kinase n=1 Tax=Desulfomonile tiedjei (strain ATCC 49306 / DSM 6799 / DCB-1) TaxID=706587 RepID=I4C0S5_DESTA|nr:PAS domain S-box protein [Desulfomonile tiedjei]AFM23166.1 PAS domain S-box [Desulfomonile tiedjei DSM 6799]
MVEKDIAIGGKAFEDSRALQSAPVSTEDSKSPQNFDMREFQPPALAKLLDSIPAPALLIDPLSRIVFANHSCSRISRNPEKLRGLSLLTLFPEQSVVPEIQRLTEQVFSTGKSQVIDSTLEIMGQRVKSRLYLQAMGLGENKWMVLFVEDLAGEQTQAPPIQPYHDEFRNRIAVCGNTQKFPFDNHQRLALALRGSDLGLWDVDLLEHRVFVDNTWTEIVGYPPDEIEPSASFWLDHVHPDDSQRLLNAWNEHLGGYAERFKAEHRIRTKSGEWKWLMARGKVVQRDDQDKPLRISGVVIDVTDRKCAEEKLLQVARVFTDAIDPIFIVDLKDTVIDLNRSAEHTYGWNRENLIGKSILTIVPPEFRERAEMFHERSKRGERVENVDVVHVTKSGVTIPILLSLSVLTNEKAEPVGIAIITKDLSNLKRTEEMLHAQMEGLKRSNKDLEEFAYLAAHDLREPLIGIAAYAKVLQKRYKENLDAQAHRFISRTLDTITRMDCLIQSLLSYSRLEGDARNLEPTDCNLALTQALANLRSAIEASGAKVINGSLPTVKANPGLLVQVFQNLISNAIRFAGDELLQIHIGALREGTEWTFFVKDNGIGIEPPYFDRIFRIFQRLESSLDRPGTGIGLANCKKIVERHGGRIWVESKPGEGSTFFFTIPDWKTSGT